jgi:hypothetical protein
LIVRGSYPKIAGKNIVWELFEISHHYFLYAYPHKFGLTQMLLVAPFYPHEMAKSNPRKDARGTPGQYLEIPK